MGYAPYMAQRFQVVVQYDTDEKVWVTYVPVLDQLSTFGSTRDEALEHTRETILGYLEAAAKEGIELTVKQTPTELVEIAV